MKIVPFALFSLIAFTAASAALFTPRSADEAFGAGGASWRFASELSKEASGAIELCYAEEGNAERILGRVDVRPFQSSEEKVPDLRILFAEAEIDGTKKVILLVGYGLRSGVFVADVPGLTTHSLTKVGAPKENPSGEFTLLGFGARVVVKKDGLDGTQGRLFFRYVARN